MDVSCSSTEKVNLRFSKENTMTDFCKTWYVGNGGHKFYPCSVLTKCPCLMPYLHICSDWLIKKGKCPFCILSSVWATVTKLGIWVVVGTSSTHMVCRH